MLFGNKTQAWFDIWSLDHFLSGVGLVLVAQWLLSRAVPQLCRPEQASLRDRQILCLLVSALLAFMWETGEFYMEAGYTHMARITDWFQGVEFWGNRMITDPVLTVGGTWAGLRRLHLVIWARLISALWLAVHVFAFPHSMYLQDLLVSLLKDA